MSYEVLSPAFASLVNCKSDCRHLAEGFHFTEGPLWNPEQGYLLFSDVPVANRWLWTADGLQAVRGGSNKATGMAYDRELNLLVCENATSCIARFCGGRREVVVSHFEDKKLNAPNDIVVDRDGVIWFTDPVLSRTPPFDPERRSELDFSGLYRVAPEGGPAELAAEKGLFAQPKGLCFSPDETFLYVSDAVQANIRAFEVRDGKLRDAGVFASGIADLKHAGGPGGIKCDALGHVWCAGPGGIWVFDPNGNLVGKIAIPERVSNLHWGAADWRTLFITASTSLYSLRTRVRPHEEVHMSSRI